MSEISKNTIFDHCGCFFLMLGLRSAVSEISENTIFEHGGCFFLMLGLRSAVTEISGNTIFVEPQVADQGLQVDLRSPTTV